MMVKDSTITDKFTLSQRQGSYIICHGLGSYYEEELAKSLSPLSETAPCFCLYFNKAFNPISNTKQFHLYLF